MIKKFVLGGILIVLFSATAVASAILLEAEDTINKFTQQPQAKVSQDVVNALDKVPVGQPQTILLLGSDRRYADIKAKLRPRSDTIIVAHLDPDKNATAIMSIPRDLIVDVPGYGRRKINEAYELGGPKLTIRTVRKLLNIPIHHVINMHFGGFRRAVDRLGCVYVDVDRRYFNDNPAPAPNSPVIDLRAEYQKRCGEKARAYVRFRPADSDFVRPPRQHDFLRQAKQQISVGEVF